MDKAGEKSASGTGLDLSREKIVQISAVVNNAQRVAARFAEIFGVSWLTYELMPEQVVLHGESLKNADCFLKIAIGDFGGRSLKLIQPVSGQSSYAEFLEQHGEGLYTVGLGTLFNHDHVVNALTRAGVPLEMQADGGNGARFSIMDTVEDLGCRIEFSSPETKRGAGIKAAGFVIPDNPAFVDMGKPVFAGGKKINQVGFVVSDERKAARRFEELLGIRGFIYDYGPPNLVEAFLDEKPVPESEMQSLDVAFANGWLGDIQIELMRPIGIHPGGCHQRFLDRHGNGFQHVSFGLQAGYDSVIDGMKEAGIGAEFSATIKEAGISATYFASQDDLGGLQLEIVGVRPA